MLLNLDPPTDLRGTSRAPTLRDILSPVFRHWVTMLVVMLLVGAATAAAVMFLPPTYDASMTLLVKRERADTIVSPDTKTGAQRTGDVTEAELNSEVELIRSRDLLEQTALASGLARVSTGPTEAAPEEKMLLAKVVKKLRKDLDVSPVRKTTLIDVRYRSADPEMAARVLNELGRLYLDKHLVVHRPAGAYEFFSEQTQRLRGELDAAEHQLLDFGRQASVVEADVERDGALQKLAEFEALLEQTRAQKADADRRIGQIGLMMAQTAQRLTTQMRTMDNPTLITSLKGKVLELELKRTELLSKFLPTYPPVVELEQELAHARESLDYAQKAPATEQTTDANPTYQWLENEMARVTSEKQAAAAREASIQQSVALYQQKARALDEKSTLQQELKRTLRSAEESYLLYLKKQEEARISDALDRTRISNVAIAEPAAVPVLPSGAEKGVVAAAGGIAAVLLGLAAAYARHFMSPYLHTPDVVEEALGVPVLASLSADR